MFRGSAPPETTSSQRQKIRKVAAGIGLFHDVLKVQSVLEALRPLPDEDVREILDTTYSKLYRSTYAPTFNAWTRAGSEIVLTDIAGTRVTLETLSFSKLLQYTMQESRVYQNLVHSLWLAKPCTRDDPYTLVLYADETIPGNVLALDQSRKTLVVSASIKARSEKITISAFGTPRART